MNGTSPANLLQEQGLIPAVETAGPGPTEDDISQLWLSLGTPPPRIQRQRSISWKATPKRRESARSSTSPRWRRCLMHRACPLSTVHAAPCCPGGDPRTARYHCRAERWRIYTGSRSRSIVWRCSSSHRVAVNRRGFQATLAPRFPRSSLHNLPSDIQFPGAVPTRGVDA
jgi:hypothetical protein